MQPEDVRLLKFHQRFGLKELVKNIFIESVMHHLSLIFTSPNESQVIH
jgi:hypothetical protein